MTRGPRRPPRRRAALACAALACALAAALPACGGRAAPDRAGASAAAEPPAEPGITLDLTPRPDLGGVIVEVRVGGPAAGAVQALEVTRAWAETRGAEVVRDLEVRDERGAIPRIGHRDEGAARLYPLSRAPGRELALRYLARNDAPEASRLGLRVAADRMTGVGHGFLLLPRVEANVPARIRWHVAALGPGAAGSSSFGDGDVVIDATSDALAHAIYAAGPIERVEDGGSRVVAMGARALDGRAVLAWSERVRALGDAAFGGAGAGARRPPGPLAIFLVGERGAGREHDGAYLGGALGLWFEGGRGFDAQLRIALAHELLHRFLGGAVRIEDGAGRAAEWFAEGFTVHYARKLLFDAGLVTPEEMRDDLERTLEERPEDGARSPHAARRAEYRLGARYAAHLDRSIRRASKGARSLDDLVTALLRQAGEAPALRVEDFRARVAEALGARAADDFDRLVVRREAPIALARDAFGPCFRWATERKEVFDLGFDPASLDGAPALVRGVQKGSAADKAGLRDGALVILAKHVPRPDDGRGARVDLTIADRRGGKRIRYAPRALRDVGRWETRPCKRR